MNKTNHNPVYQQNLQLNQASLSSQAATSNQQNKQKKARSQQLKEIVLKNQSSAEKGYYTFQEWRQLHQAMFALTENHITSTVINCWRILKLINFGDDFVPTGLVYDCLMTLINVDQTVDQTEVLLKSIFFKFIEFNGKFLSEKQKSELAFFKVVRNIVDGYRKIIVDNLNIQDDQNASEGRSELNGKVMSRNEQLYRLHNVFTYKKNLEKLKNIEYEFKECSFQPKINESSKMGQSRYLKNLNKSNEKAKGLEDQENYGVIDETEEFKDTSQVSYGFKANPVPDYPEYNPVGLNQHLQRMQRSRQIRKINSLQNSLRKSVNTGVQEFSINERTEQRKKRKLQNCKILFMIKVQVGKRTYRVKVRQNMNAKQVVSAIQSMVGFKDSQIEEVVKGYFVNWENRQKKKSAYAQIADNGSVTSISSKAKK